MPVAFDELEYRHVIVVGMVDIALSRKRRHDDQGNAGAVTEKIEDLNVAAVVITAALVGCNQDRRFAPDDGIGLDLGDKLPDKLLQRKDRRIGRVTGV